MKKAKTETYNPNNGQETPKKPQRLSPQIACLSVFPMMYLIGKAVVTFLH